MKNSNLKRKYKANVKNELLKKCMCDQSDNSNIAIRDEKAQHVHLGRNRWRTLSLRWFFVSLPLY